jgi:hypothetical protein
MSSLLELLIGALLLWGLAICFFGSLVLALALGKAVPAFDAALALMLVILASTFGVYWHARAEAGIGVLEKLPPEKAALSKISAPVAFLGFAFVGFFLGSVLLQINGSVTLSALALLFCSVPVVAWHRWVLANQISWRYMAFSYTSVFLGFALGVMFLRINTGF